MGQILDYLDKLEGANKYGYDKEKAADYSARIDHPTPAYGEVVAGATLNPDLYEHTVQSGGTNWWNTMMQNIDQIQLGAATGEIARIDAQLEQLSSGVDVGASYEELNNKKTQLLSEVDKQQHEIRNEPVDLSFRLKTAVANKEEDSSFYDTMGYELPGILGGNFSSMGATISQMVLPTAGTWAAAAAGGGPGASLVAGVAGAAAGFALGQYARKQESNAEVGDAYESKMQRLMGEYAMTHGGQMPAGEDLQKIKSQAHVGLQELYDKNMMLQAGDYIDLALAVTPWSKWLKLASESRAGRNLIRGGVFGADTYKEGVEEGVQFIWQQDYLNNKFDDKNAYSDILSDVGRSAQASLGYGDPSLYTNPDFRSATRGGFIGGAMFMGLNNVTSLISDHISYNSTLSALSAEAASKVEDQASRFKGQTLLKLFDKGKENFIYNALNHMGNSNTFGLSKEDAAEEIANIRELHKEYESINNPTKGLLGKFWNELDAKANRSERGLLKSHKQSAFLDVVDLKHNERKLKNLEEMADAEGATDSEGFISSLTPEIETSVKDNLAKLDISDDIKKSIHTNRFDVLIQAQKQKIADLRKSVTDTMSGAKLLEYRRWRLRALKGQDVEVFNYASNELGYIKHARFYDNLRPSIVTADNASIRKHLKDGDVALPSLVSSVESAGLPLTKDTYLELEKAVTAQVADHEVVKAQLNTAEESLYDEYGGDISTPEKVARIEELKAKDAIYTGLTKSLEAIKNNITDNTVTQKTDSQYRREFAELGFKETENLESELKSIANTPLQRAGANLSRLQKKLEIYKSYKELRSLPEFNGYLEKLQDLITRAEAIVKEVDRRINDREATNEKIHLNAITAYYDTAGLNLVVDAAAGKIELVMGPNKLLSDLLQKYLGPLIDSIRTKVQEAYAKDRTISSVYPEAIIQALKKAATAAELESLYKESISELFTAIKGSGFFNERLTDEDLASFLANPVKNFVTLGFKLVKEDTEVFTLGKIIRDYGKHGSTSRLKEELVAAGFQDRLPAIDLFDRAIAIHSLRLSVNSTYNVGNELEIENAFFNANPDRLAPSKQQLISARAFIKWFKAPIPKGVPFANTSYLTGSAGTGKTVLAGLIRKLLGLGDVEVFVAAHSKSAFKTAATATGIDSTVKKYDTDRSMVDHLLTLLNDKSELLKGTKLIILDEAGFISYNRLADLLRALESYNETTGSAIKVLSLGDAFQLREDAHLSLLETNTNSQTNINLLPPLTVVYRTNVSDITSTANSYYDNETPVIDLKTRVSPDHATGVITSKSTADLLTEIATKAKAGKLTDNKRRLVIVNDQAAVAAMIEQLNKLAASLGVQAIPIEVSTYIDAQGDTVDEVYVDLVNTGLLRDTAFFNRAMYTAITRAKNFAFVVDRNLSVINKPEVSNDLPTGVQDLEEFTKNKIGYLTSIKNDLAAYKALGFKSEAPKASTPVSSATSTATGTDVDITPPIAEPTPEEGAKQITSAQVVPPGIIATVDPTTGEVELMYPQSFLKDADGNLPLAVADKVFYTKAITEDGEVHIRVVKETATSNEFVLVGIIGSRPNTVASELELLAATNPELAAKLQAALTDNTIPVKFTNRPGKKGIVFTKSTDIPVSIATASVRDYTPFSISFSDEFSSVDLALKDKIVNDIKNSFLKQGQVADNIKVKATIYTNNPTNMGEGETSDSIETLYKEHPHQKWVKVGRPYLRAEVTLKGTTIVFNIPCEPKVLSSGSREHLLGPLIKFYESVKELEAIYVRVLGDKAPLYGIIDPSGIEKGDKPITKLELFRKSVSWYPTGDMASLLKDNNSQEKQLNDLLMSKLTKEEQDRVHELRKNIHSLGGIQKPVPVFNQSTLTEEDNTPVEVDAPLTKSTNKILLGETSEGGFTVFDGSKGVVAVKYYKYKGLFIKLKSKVEKLGSEYRLIGKIEANVQRTTDTSVKDFNVSRRIGLSYGYSADEFDNEHITSVLDEVLERAGKRNTVLQEGTGQAQKVMDNIARANTTVTSPEGFVITLREAAKAVNAQGELVDTTKGISIWKSDGAVDSNLLEKILYDNNSGLRTPVKLSASRFSTSGDNLDLTQIETQYSGISPTRIVLKLDEAPIAPTSTDPAAPVTKKVTKFGFRAGRLLSKRLNTKLGANLSRSKAISLLKSMVPDISDEQIRFVSQLEMDIVSEGEQAWGYFKDGVVYLLEDSDGTVKENAVRHEAFHRIFWMSTTKAERLEVLRAAVKAGNLKGATLEEVEEWLAREFQVFRATKKTRFSALRDFFKKIAAYLGFIDANKYKLDQYFKKILDGRLHTIKDSVNLSRGMFDITERFGNVNNYMRCKMMLMASDNSVLERMFKFSFTESKVTIDSATGELQDIPLTLEEATKKFIEEAKEYIQAVANTPEMFVEDQTEVVKILKILINPKKHKGLTNIEAIVKEFYRSDVDLLDLSEIDDLEESADLASAANLAQEIMEGGFTNPESKTTSAIKNFLTRVVILNSEGGEQVPSSFTFVKLFEIFEGLRPGTSTFEKELSQRWDKAGILNPKVNALYLTLEQLKELKDATVYLNSSNTRTALPRGEFKSSHVFIDGDGKKIVRLVKKVKGETIVETTSNFFKRIVAETQVTDLNAINVLYRKRDAIDTWNQIVSFFTSYRRKSVYAATKNIKEQFQDGARLEPTTKFLPYSQDASGIETVIRADIKAGFRRAVESNKIKGLYNAILLKKFKTEKDALLRFYTIVGVIDTADMLTDEFEINEAYRDMKALVESVVNSENVEATLANSKGRLDKLAELITVNNVNVRAGNYMDQKNRKRYGFLLQSGLTSIMRRFQQWIKNSKVYTGPKFIVDNPATQRFKSNIFVKKINTVYAIRDYDSIETKDDIFGKPIEYFSETPEDITNRKYNVNFIGTLANTKTRYIQQVYTISNKPMPISYEVDVLTKKNLKLAILEAIDFELSRPAYAASLVEKGLGIGTLEKNADHFYFAINRKLTAEEKRMSKEALADMLLKALVEKAKKEYEVVKEDPDFDSRVGSIHALLAKNGSLPFSNAVAEDALIDPALETFIAFHVNNAVNGYFLGNIYNSDPAFAKGWFETIKRLQSMGGMGKSPNVGKDAMMPTTRIAVLEDLPLFINETTDFSGKLEKLYKSDPKDSYESTDGQLYFLTEFKEELIKGYGTNEGISNILKPVIYSIDENGIPRVIKVAGVELTNSLCAKFPELAELRKQLKDGRSKDGQPIHAALYASGLKMGKPKKIARVGERITNEHVIEIDSQDIRIQLNPIAKIDNEIPQFTQLLYLLNTNRQNPVETAATYEAISSLVKMANLEFTETVMTDGVADPAKIRSVVLNSFIKEGLITSGSQRFYELLNNKDVDINLPAVYKKVTVQILASITRKVINPKFSGSKLILTTGANIRLFYKGDLDIATTYDKLEENERKSVDSFYSTNDGVFTYAFKQWLIKAQEAKDFQNDAIEESEKHAKSRFLRGLHNATDVNDVQKTLLIDYLNSTDRKFQGLKVPRRLRMVRDPKTGDNYAEIIMSESKAMEIAKSMNLTTFDLLNTLIGVRIPTSGINSALPIKIVGFFGKEENNLVAVPEELTPLHGSDFDVDSLFVIRRELVDDDVTNAEDKNGKYLKSVYRPLTEQEQEEASANYLAVADTMTPEEFADVNSLWWDKETFQFTLGAARLFSKGEVIGYKDGVFDPNFIENVLDPEMARVQEYTGNPKIQKNILNKLTEIKKRYYKNTIFNNYLEILTAERNRKDMLNQISQAVFTDDIFPEMQSLLGVDDLLGDNKDLNSFLDQREIQLINMTGANQVGAIANTMRTFAYLLYSAQARGLEAELRLSPENTLTINGIPLTKIEDTEVTSTGTPNKVWDLFNSILNSAIDNVKDQRLSIINLTDVTGKAISVMVGLGVSMKDIVFMMNQSVMKQISLISKSRKRDKAIEVLKNKSANVINGLDPAGAKSFFEGEWRKCLTTDNLRHGLSMRNATDNGTDLEYHKVQYATLKYFETFSGIGEDVFKVSRGLTLLRNWPISYSKLKEAIKNLEYSMTNDFAFKNTSLIDSTVEGKVTPGVKHIQTVYDIANGAVKLLQEAIYINNPQAEIFLSKIAELFGIDMTRPESIDSAKDELTKYLISLYPDYVNNVNDKFSYSTDTGREAVLVGNPAWIQNFILKVADYKVATKDTNMFTKFMSSESVYGNPSILKLVFHGGTALNDDEKLIVADDFKALPIELQEGFLKYSVLIQGAQFGVSSYSNYISDDVLAKLSGFISTTVKDALLNPDKQKLFMEHYALQLAIHHPEFLTYLDNTTNNTAKDPTSAWDFYVDGKVEDLPLFVRAGWVTSATVYVRVNIEEAGEKHRGYYQKVGAAHNIASTNDITSNIYQGSPKLFENGWKIADSFKENKRVETADSKLGAAPIEGRNVLERDLTGDYAVSFKYTEGQDMYLVDKYDIARENIYAYTVDKVTESEGTIKYALKESTKKYHSGKTKAPGRRLDRIALQKQFDTLARVFGKKGITVSLEMDETISEAGSVEVIKNGKTISFKVTVNPEHAANAQTVGHEFIHIMIGAIGGMNNPAVREALASVLEKFPDLAAEIRKDSQYSNDSKEKQDEEILVTVMGKYASELLGSKPAQAKFKIILKRLIRAIVAFFTGKQPDISLPEKLVEDMILGAFEINSPKYNDKSYFKAATTPLETALAELKKNFIVSPDQENYVHTLTQKLYKRVNTFKDEAFSPYEKGLDWATAAANRKFQYKDKTKDRISFKRAGVEEFLTYDEYVNRLKKVLNTDKAKGKIIHKLIEYYLTGKSSIVKELDEIAAEKPDQYPLDWNRTNGWLSLRWNSLLGELGLVTGREGILLGNDILTSEVVLANEELGLAGTADLLVKHVDGTYSIVDFKSGNSIIANPIYQKLMKYGEENGGTNWTNMSQAKLQLMIYAMLLKSIDPSVVFRDLKVAHLTNGAVAQISHSVEFGDYLGLLRDYFKSNNLDWYNNNKHLFDLASYGGSLLSVDQDLAKVKNTPAEQQQVYLARLRKLYIAAADPAKSEMEKATIQEQINQLTDKSLQTEVMGQRLHDTTQDMSILRRWFDNIYNVKNKAVQAYARLLLNRKNGMRQYLVAMRTELNEKLQPVLDEYHKGTYKGMLDRVTRGNINMNSYKEMYDFMWDTTPEGRVFRIVKGNMTDAQWEYSQWVRKTMRNEFYLTMNPRALVPILEAELKLATSPSEKALLEETLKTAKLAPDVNKLNEFKAFKGKDFVWTPEFSPMVPKGLEEHAEDGINMKLFQAYVDQQKEKYFAADMAGAELIYGLPIKYMNNSGEDESRFTKNSTLVFDNFVTNMVSKRYLDDMYSLGMGLSQYMQLKKDISGIPNMQNTAAFLEDQVMLQVLDGKKTFKWFQKDLRIGGRKVNIDYILRALKSYFGFMIMALKLKGGLVNGLMEILFNHKAALTGTLAKSFGIAPDDIDFTQANLIKANALWAELQYAKISGKEHENKVYNLLKKFDYQTDNFLYPVTKEALLGAKNKALQSSIMYASYSVLEQYTNGILLVAQMLHNGTFEKYDNKGNWVGGVRGVTVKGEKLEGLTSEEITKLKKVSERIHGSYRSDERAATELYVIGSWLMQLKRFIPNMLHTAYSSKYSTYALGKWIDTGKTTTIDENGKEVELKIFDWEDKVTEGRMRIMIKHILAGRILNNMFFSVTKDGHPRTNYRWDRLTNEQKIHVLDIYVQIGMYLTLLLAVDTLFDGTPEDDEWKRRMGRVPGDLAQGWNFMDLIRAGVNPTTVMPKMYQISQGMYEFFIQSGLQGQRITKGEHAGEWKGKHTMSKAIPFYGQLSN